MNGPQKQHDDLSAYLDGQLDASHAERIAQALRRDADLARELEQIKAVRAMVRDLPREKAPDDFVARVLEQAERQKLMHATHVTTDARPQIWIRMMAAAAVIMLLVGVGGPILRTLWVSSQIHRAPPQVAAAGRAGETAKAGDKSYVAPPGAPHAETLVATSGVRENLGKGSPRGKEAGPGWGGGEVSVVVNTDNVCYSMREVRQVLEEQDAANGIGKGADAMGKNGSDYEVRQADGDRAEILAMVPQEQVPALKSRLRGLSQENDVAAAEGCEKKENETADKDGTVTKDGKLKESQGPAPALPSSSPAGAARGGADTSNTQPRPAATPNGPAPGVLGDENGKPKARGDFGLDTGHGAIAQKDDIAQGKGATPQPASQKLAFDKSQYNKPASSQANAAGNMQQMRIIIQNRPQNIAASQTPPAASAPTSAQSEIRTTK